MPHFTLWFETEALRDRLLPVILLRIPWQRLLWAVWRWFGDEVDVPFWHERFYAWLTRRAMEGDT